MDSEIKNQLQDSLGGNDDSKDDITCSSKSSPTMAASSVRERSTSPEGPPPPLPPRPNTLNLLDEGASSSRTLRQSTQSALQSRATTAVSLTDIASHDGGKESYPARGLPGTLRAKASLSHLASPRGSDTADSASVKSSVPQTDFGEVENVFSDFVATESGPMQHDSTGLLQFPEFQPDDVDDDFTEEFEPVGDVGDEGENEGV